MRLIDADKLREKLIIDYEVRETYFGERLLEVIDNAPTVKPQKIVTIPHELIEKLVLCVVNTVENIDWDKAIEAYKERPQVTVFTETADEKAVADLKAELQRIIEARPLEARPQGEYVDISKLRLMTVEECEGHTIDYARGWRACIEWIKKGGAE